MEARVLMEIPMPRRQLAFGTISFAICFAVWGLVSAFAPRFREIYHLSTSQGALLVAVPVLLGSLARLPMGLLTDRYRGRVVFSVLMLCAAVPAFLIPEVHSYSTLLVVAFFLGMAGSSFSVGVGFVSPWFSRETQGSALGVYGLGNIGQSAVVFLGPLLAARVGWQNVYRGTAVLLVVWAIAFGLVSRNANIVSQKKSLSSMLAVLGREPNAWALSAFYFLSFGGFVAFSIYMPSLLRDEFHLSATDAGLRTAGFVVLATLLRPIGGFIADRIGGAHLLSYVFLGIVPFALLLSWSEMIPFTIGALGCAAMLGLANGAVFKLVPQFFPKETGTVTGLVGAMGGLGGFFPPLLLGIFKDNVGVVWPGFVLLAATAFLMWLLNWKLFLRREAVVPRTRFA
jgi:MFS transporter, NNP family, nitrate/nitrite transporter